MPMIQHISAKTGEVVREVWEDDPIPPPPTEADYARTVQAHIEATAIARRYDSAASCASYVASTVPQWWEEAQAFVAWRDQVWAQVYAAQSQFNPSHPQPTIAEVIESLPAIEWPDN